VESLINITLNRLSLLGWIIPCQHAFVIEKVNKICLLIKVVFDGVQVPVC
jgi:hypothetical protein